MGMLQTRRHSKHGSGRRRRGDSITVIHKFLHGQPKLARTRLLPLLLAANATAMRLVLQRVKRASVTVDEEVVGEIGKGMLVLVGIHRDDVDADAAWCRAVHK